ncbi:MAG: hypothetical protein WC445_01145 [Patescibacteria group bacterium]
MALGNKTKVMREIPAEWDRLIKFAEALKFGEAKVVFQNGRPVRIDHAIQQIKIDNEKDFDDGLKTIPLI